MHAEIERLSKWTVVRAACRMYSIHPTWVVLTDNKDGFTSAQNPQQTETGTVAALGLVRSKTQNGPERDPIRLVQNDLEQKPDQQRLPFG